MKSSPKSINPPTLSDVARLASVSVATASRALSNPDLVAEDTRKSVLDAAASCGYRVNLLARSLRKRRTDTLLVLIPEINNEFYPEIITSMEHRAHAEGFAMILGLTENQLEREHSYFELLGAQRADGLAILDGGIDRLIEQGVQPVMPVVQVLECTGGPSMPSVLTDDHKVSEQAVTHLWDLGHRRIAHISGSKNSLVSWERITGFRSALERRGATSCNDMIVDGNYCHEGGEAAMHKLLSLDLPPTAVFCANDASALGALRACRESGRRVPDDISIIGVDDTSIATMTDPALTTIRQPRADIGKAAINLLIDMVRGKRDIETRIVIPTQLVVRGSTAPPPA